MPSANAASTPELFDEDGLIRDFASWSEPLAEAVAQDAGVGPLTDAHWKIIRAMRRRAKEQKPPAKVGSGEI